MNHKENKNENEKETYTWWKCLPSQNWSPELGREDQCLYCRAQGPCGSFGFCTTAERYSPTGVNSQTTDQLQGETNKQKQNKELHK